ncbi:MAG: hypothetical protein QM831_31485 [Kofleriaceae bacterium]
MMNETGAAMPPEPWREQFEEQATNALLERLQRAARTRLRTFAGRTGHVDSADVDDIVNGVLIDTFAGQLTWDPEKETLEHNLLDAVRFRVRDRWLRDRRVKHDSIDEDERDRGVSDQAAAGAIVQGAPVPTERDREIKSVFDDVVDALRPLCTDKPEVMQLLALYVQGVTDRDEAIHEGMTKTSYHNARRCLGRLVLNLPAKLRDSALAAITN